LGAAARAGDATQVAASAKDFIQSTNTLISITNDQHSDNPAIVEHVNELQTLAPQVIQATKAKLMNGEDEAVDEKLKSVVAAALVPVAALAADVAKSPEFKLKATGKLLSISATRVPLCTLITFVISQANKWTVMRRNCQ
jgi:hypothetical protein